VWHYGSLRVLLPVFLLSNNDDLTFAEKFECFSRQNTKERKTKEIDNKLKNDNCRLLFSSVRVTVAYNIFI
jgi:hypothetical protein